MVTNFVQQLVETLERLGVKRIYGLVGDSLNPLSNAVRTSSIEWIHVRNEEAAAFAAAADSLSTGELAVCGASCGPGNTHLIQGLYEAHRNGAKVLAIASHIPSLEIGSEFFQATHPEYIFQECSGYREVVHSGTQGARVLHNALQSTLAGGGVSVMVVPGDVFNDEVVDSTTVSSTYATGTAKRVFPDPAEAAALVRAINEADTVTMFCGYGARDAREQVFALAEKIKSPIGHSFRGKMFIAHDNPFDVGMSGLLGYGACYEASKEADLFIMVGTDFPYTEWLPHKNVAQIDIDGTHIGRRTKVAVPVVGDVASVIDNILPHIEEKEDRSFLDRMLTRHAALLEDVVSKYTTPARESRTPIHPEFAASVLDEVAADDAIITVDTGMCNVWSSRYFTPNGRRAEHASYLHGTMANALPMAIGIQAANPDRQVISWSGDGGLSMLLGELLTVKLHNLPIKTVVFNNSSLGMVKLEMIVEGFPDFQTDHEQVNFAAIAEGVGIKSFRVEDPSDLKQALVNALTHDGPALVDIVTDPDALSLPPDISWDMLKGFTTASVKTVLDGGVGRMVNLARRNIRQIGAATAIVKP
ncbi:pyruvate dehydrogenase [Corynebacterium sanguinis]|uniref:pyruvate dehydrogenase n=1 Tax=Corynebacterium sanguinis TaxID=2594913 RepID=UPI001185BDE4|nr:pyruvate dehydrogenase [Corynebacterium sanguinis]MCT1492185.1 pyruvate dehydrogenase [Corynebacterium sanguinis]MCT2247364.1 pyruvate dehydrogenase [Corynebacterium sanguinis]QDR77509.1 pyruvate dehydrogenase [Corynebacterium sanguinis]